MIGALPWDSLWPNQGIGVLIMGRGIIRDEKWEVRVRGNVKMLHHTLQSRKSERVKDCRTSKKQ